MKEYCTFTSYEFDKMYANGLKCNMNDFIFYGDKIFALALNKVTGKSIYSCLKNPDYYFVYGETYTEHDEYVFDVLNSENYSNFFKEHEETGRAWKHYNLHMFVKRGKFCTDVRGTFNNFSELIDEDFYDKINEDTAIFEKVNVKELEDYLQLGNNSNLDELFSFLCNFIKDNPIKYGKSKL